MSGELIAIALAVVILVGLVLVVRFRKPTVEDRPIHRDPAHHRAPFEE